MTQFVFYDQTDRIQIKTIAAIDQLLLFYAKLSLTVDPKVTNLGWLRYKSPNK